MGVKTVVNIFASVVLPGLLNISPPGIRYLGLD